MSNDDRVLGTYGVGNRSYGTDAMVTDEAYSAIAWYDAIALYCGHDTVCRIVRAF